MNILLTIIYIFLLSTLGFSFLDYFYVLESKSLSIKVSIGFGLGIGVVVLEMLLLSFAGIPWDREVVYMPWAIWLLFWIIAKKRKFFFKIPSIPKSRFDFFLLLLIGSVFCYALIESQLRPVFGWDVIATWFMMAKGFFLEKGVHASLYHYLQVDNPPGAGILLSSLYIFLGGIDDQVSLLLFSFFYGFLLVVLFNYLKERIPERYAFVFTFLFASTQAVLRQAGRYEAGYIDLPLAYFFLVSAVLLRETIEKNKKSIFFLGALFASFGTLFKNEGLPYFIIYIIVLFIFSRTGTLVSKIKYIILPIFIFLLWQIYKFSQNTYYTYYLESRIVLERIPGIFIESVKEFGNIGRWNLLWIYFFVNAFINYKRNFKKPIFFLFLLQLFAYLSIFVFTPLDYIDHMHASFDRLLLQISPLAMLLIAEVSYTILRRGQIAHAKDTEIPRSKNTRSAGRGKQL